MEIGIIGPISLSGNIMEQILRQEYLICYDIENNKIRKKIYDELARNGLRAVQKSVFWGYLTRAELNSIRRFISNIIDKDDKSLITRTNFHGRGFSYLIGHKKEDFEDWEENSVI